MHIFGVWLSAMNHTLNTMTCWVCFSNTTAMNLRWDFRYLLSFQAKHLATASAAAATAATSPLPTHDNIVHLILEQKSAAQTVQTFRWASRLPNFTHSQSTYRALIHKLCRFRRFDIVKQLLDEMPDSIGSAPEEGIFITIVRGLGHARMIREVIKVPELVNAFGQNPSLKIFNSILDVLVKENIDIAREFYRKTMMERGVEGDDYTYGILMKGLCLTNRVGDGFKLLQLMKTRGIKPNVVIYNTLLHALCKNGKIGRARSLMNEMEGCNVVTFNILISGYCKEENLVQALVLLEKSFSMGFVPDVVTITKVVEILCNASRVTEAAEVLERVESKGGVVDVVAYNTLIKGFCRLGKAKVGRGFLKEMESKGRLPTVDTYNILISSFCECGMLDSALDVFNDMQTDGVKWNFITYDTLIRGLCLEGRVQEGFQILELMEDSKTGCEGRISPYNSILYGLYKTKRWDEVIEFLEKMRAQFSRAVDRSFCILQHCEEKAIQEAKRVYDQMISEGGFPSVLVCDRLVHGFSQQGCIREAIELMNEMIGLNYLPGAQTFNAIIRELCRQDKVDIAIKFTEDIVQRRCIPDTESYSPLIDAFSRKGNLQQALKLLMEMVGRGIAPDTTIWNSLLFCLSREIRSKDMLHNNGVLRKIMQI